MRTSKPTVTILAPCFNEIEGVQKVLPQIKKAWYDQILVLDGWSTDGSPEWCKKNGYEVLMRSKPNTGLWKAYKEAFDSGKIIGDIVITLSPDGNSPPSAIPALVRKIEDGYDMVIASRYLEGARSDDDTRMTRFGNWSYTKVINAVGRGYTYTDALVMYRAYRRVMVKYLNLLEPPSWIQRQLIKMNHLYSFEPSLSIRAARIPLRITEIPVTEPLAFRPRRQSSFSHATTVMLQILHEGLLR